jgi:prepilin-type N-terminal cleavage/methylation domain-containing protein
MKRRGFTLVELMIVVGILAVLVTMALIAMYPRKRAVDVAYQFADLVHEASREAITYGPVRADVVVASGSLGKARTCIIGAGAANTSPTFTLELIIEGTTSGSFTLTSTGAAGAQQLVVDSNVVGAYYSPQIGPLASVTPQNTNWNNFKVCCYDDGTCDGQSLFFQANHGASYELTGRVSVLPLGAATQVKANWTQ